METSNIDVKSIKGFVLKKTISKFRYELEFDKGEAIKLDPKKIIDHDAFYMLAEKDEITIMDDSTYEGK